MGLRRSLLAVAFLACLAGHADAQMIPQPWQEACWPSLACGDGGSRSGSDAPVRPTMYGDIINPSVLFFGRGLNGAPRPVAQIPLAARADYKIDDDESPAPLDRVFLNWNYFNNVNKATSFPAQGVQDLHTESIGIEKTILDGDASLGLRIPAYYLSGDATLDDDRIGDLTLIGKYALSGLCSEDRVVSTGLALTLPTGTNPHLPGTVKVNPVLFQPFVGYLWSGELVCVQGFSSLVVPLDARDAVLFLNDIQVATLLYHCRDRFLSGVWPLIEAHLTTPLDRRGSVNTPVGVPDVLTVTLGTTFVLKERCQVNVGAGIPVTGPQPFDVQAVVQINLRF